MAKDVKSFLKTKRKKTEYRPVSERVKDFKEVTIKRAEDISVEQASRCMDCGTPFCHWACPVGNYIPEWNDYVTQGKWEKAYELLSAQNNFPEFTGRLCPALCEFSCVLGINNDPVTVRENELAIIEHAFKNGFVKPKVPEKRTGKHVAVIGSGPAGLACASQLNKAGHKVTVFEKDEELGGILRLGIPDFKIEKNIIDRRLEILKAEGIEFKTNQTKLSAKDLKKFDAICLTGGSRQPRDLKVEGRDLKGIYFAMDYLMQSNRRVCGKKYDANELIDTKGKKVLVIGGGDTGADCVGTAHRQGALRVTQVEVMPRPAECRTEVCPWPMYPMILKISTSHEEGGQRDWAVLTKKFIGENGHVKKVSCVRVEAPAMKEIPGSEFELDIDFVVLAIGFLQPEHSGLLDELGLLYDDRGNVKTDANFMSSVKGVFAAGDMRRGQSLIVWAIHEGRKAAENINKYLK